MTVDEATIAFAHRLADAAGEVIRPYFRRRIDVADKKPVMGGQVVFDPVTEADKGAEKAIRAIIDAERPDDGILGEEYGEKPGTSGRRWVLDPVDGTRAFITGRYEWGSLIALEENGRAVLGVIDQPVLGERFVGANGETRLHEDGESVPLKARACADMADAILVRDTSRCVLRGGRARRVPPRGAGRAHDPLGRGLLHLRDLGARLRRSDRGDDLPSLGRGGADPGGRRRGRASSPIGRAAIAARAARCSPPAIRASTPRR